MKYIGNVLLKDKLLSEEHLLECLVEKMDSVPHLSRVVFDKKLLSVEQQLKVFRFLSENSTTSYIGACKSLNFWDKKFENEVVKLVDEKHKTLSEVIISKNYMNWDQLIDVFDRFFNEDTTDTDEPMESVNSSSKEVKSNPQEGQKDISKFVALYENFFSQEKFDHINSFLSSAESGEVKFDDSFIKQIEDIKSLLFEVYSSAEFIEATYSIKLLGAGIDYINRVIEKKDIPSDEFEQLIKSAGTLMKKNLKVVWSLRNNLVESGSEILSNGPKPEDIDKHIDEMFNQKNNL